MNVKRIFCLFLIAALVAGFFNEAEARKRKRKKKKKAPQTESVGRSIPDSISTSQLHVYPIGIFNSTLRLGFEQLLTRSNSLRVSISYATGENSRFYDLEDFTEYAAELQYKIFLSRTAAPGNGIFMGPTVSYRGINGITRQVFSTPDPEILRYEVGPKTASALNIGYVLGVQRYYGSYIVVTAYAGGGINLPYGDYKAISTGLNLYSKGVVPNLGLSFGLRF